MTETDQSLEDALDRLSDFAPETGTAAFVDAVRAVRAAARADVEARIEALVLPILANVRYERDEDDNWHSIYSDKPAAAAATERARAALAAPPPRATDGPCETCGEDVSQHCGVVAVHASFVEQLGSCPFGDDGFLGLPLDSGQVK